MQEETAIVGTGYARGVTIEHDGRGIVGGGEKSIGMGTVHQKDGNKITGGGRTARTGQLPCGQMNPRKGGVGQGQGRGWTPG